MFDIYFFAIVDSFDINLLNSIRILLDNLLLDNILCTG